MDYLHNKKESSKGIKKEDIFIYFIQYVELMKRLHG